jgi:hypothetical protein
MEADAWKFGEIDVWAIGAASTDIAGDLAQREPARSRQRQRDN